jgi:predicted adenine nucleotide alpha hydrolase (AANH) superfamily ATPase
MVLRILIHICCAPCFTVLHKHLASEGFDVVGYFYNPNIHPYKEYLERLHCVERYTALRPVSVIYDKEYNLDKYLVGALQAKYDPPAGFKPPESTKSQPPEADDQFHDKIEVKESLQIRLQAKEPSSADNKTIDITSSENSHSGTSAHGNPDFNPRCGYCIGLRLSRTAKRAADDGFDTFTTTLLESKYQPHDYIKALGERLAEKYGIDFYYYDFRTKWKDSIRLSKELELYRQQYCGCIFSEYERFGPEARER